MPAGHRHALCRMLPLPHRRVVRRMICKPPSCRPPLLLSCEKAGLARSRLLSLTDENGSIRGRLVQWTLIILSQCEAREHADRGSKRHCNQEPDEPEQISKSEQSENYPYGIQMNAAPDQIG